MSTVARVGMIGLGVVGVLCLRALQESSTTRAPAHTPHLRDDTGIEPDHSPAKQFVIGLHNLGNSCFVNSVLQALAAVPPVLDWFKTVHAIGKLETQEELFTDHVLQTLEDLSSLHTAENASLGLMPRAVMAKFTDYFAGHRQEDAQEFLHLLMNVVDAEEWLPVWELRRVPSLVDLLDIMGVPGDARLMPLLRSPRSAIEEWQAGQWLTSSGQHMNPMTGWFATSCYCMGCERASPWQNQSFLSLPLPLGARSSLTQCIAAFTADELINDYKCEYCRRHSKVIKRMSLTRLPSVLCMHLHRREFTAAGVTKNQAFVMFPMKLNMEPFMRKQLAHLNAHNNTGTKPGPTATVKPATAVGGTRGGNPDSVPHVAASAAGAAEGTATPPPSASTTKPPTLASKLAIPEPIAAPFRASDSVSSDPEVDRPSPVSAPAQSPTLGSEEAKFEMPKLAPIVPRDYSLMSVVQHIGGPESGHYFTFRRVPQRVGDATHTSSSKWVRASDNSVVPVEERDVLGCQAYLLFYVRDDQCGLPVGANGAYAYSV